METCRTCAKCDFDNETQWFDLFNAPRWQLETERIHLELNTWKIKVICLNPFRNMLFQICI